jgi:hypothetical protein
MRSKPKEGTMRNNIYFLAAMIAASTDAWPVMAKSIRHHTESGEQAKTNSLSSDYAKLTTRDPRLGFANPSSPVATGGASLGYNSNDLQTR